MFGIVLVGWSFIITHHMIHCICQIVAKTFIFEVIIYITIITGRYNNVPYNDRLCKHCDINEIGNEYHFLMSCRNSKFISLRNIFMNNLCKINRSFCLFTQQDIFRYIMAIQNKTIMNLVAKSDCYDILAVFESLN
jgi:hypothetical protein